MFYLHYPRTHDQAARNFWRCEWNNPQEKEDEEIVNILTTGFKRLLDAWPFHLAEINELGQMRYCLTDLEKERLKSLGLQNLFSTAWPKPDPRCCRPSRWKKT
jgi:hypothetical protein